MKKPIDNNYRVIPIGSIVYIIETQYVKFNPITFGEEVLESNSDKFLSGIVLENKGDSYTVQIGAYDIRFRESPRTYFFRKHKID